MKQLTVGSLFSGIGGLEKGLEDTGGFKTVWQVECDSYAQKVLKKHWPDVGRWDDVRTFPPAPAEDWRCDVICGGFPCQDVSVAGRRVGLSGERSGLWYEFVRVLCVLRPRFAIVENTPGLFDRGFGEVLGTLAEIGYDAEWSTVSACAMGAPFTRSRVFVVAFPASKRQRQLRGFQRKDQSEEERNVCWQGLESRVSRTANGVPAKMDRLRCLGNAVVPQVAQWIGERILESLEPTQPRQGELGLTEGERIVL